MPNSKPIELNFEFIAFQVSRRLNALPQRNFISITCSSPMSITNRLCHLYCYCTHISYKRLPVVVRLLQTSSFFQQDQNIIITKFVWCILKYLPPSCARSVSVSLAILSSLSLSSFLEAMCSPFLGQTQSANLHILSQSLYDVTEFFYCCCCDRCCVSTWWCIHSCIVRLKVKWQQFP